MYILGLSCYYHDSAAVLLKNGQIVAAIEEERLSRKKHDAGFPKNAIDFCLKQAGIKSQQIDYVVFYEKPFRKLQRIIFTSLATFPFSWSMFREAMRVTLTQKLWIKQDIASYLNINSDKILFSQHHLSHAAACFYPSPFKKSAILTLDGVGEWATSSYGKGENNKIKIFKEINFPQSLGLFYSAFTAFLGFEVNEGEWKVMGLAPYGKSTYAKKIRKTVNFHDDGSFSLNFDYFSFQHSDSQSYSNKLVELMGQPFDQKNSHLITPRSANIAASIQKVTEELILHLAKFVKKETQSNNLCIGGGVALNSVANYILLKSGLFKNIFIQPATGDSGGALGAALYLYHQILNHQKRYLFTPPYFGQGHTNNDIKKFLKTKQIEFKEMTETDLIKFVSDKIIDGKVIGWMQNKFEWGPRALGNRSILADARRKDMKDIINNKVKFREAFRPFAPSCLAEHADEIFDLPKNYQKHWPLKYMLYVVPVKKNWQKKVPAINHADNSARPQLVFKQENPLYHKLISHFYKKTGVPLILNTSFNLKGEAIVGSPEDAYSTYVRSGIDILVMGNCVLEK